MKIGTMQGRLSVPQNGLMQFFPHEWEEEFKTASILGFTHIEWLLDWRDWHKNPMVSDIEQLQEKLDLFRCDYGVSIRSICADYFMEHPLYSLSNESFNLLKHLCRCSLTAQKNDELIIVLPLLEKVAPRETKQFKEIIRMLTKLCRNGIKNKLAFETELTALELKSFIDEARTTSGTSRIGVCYDIGNATSYGYDCPTEIAMLGDYIFDVHIKDRKIGSSQSVMLGNGDARLAGCFSILKKNNFCGPYILQAWRGGEYLVDAREQLMHCKGLMKNL